MPRDIDVAVLGASGFTGEFVARYVAASANGEGISWAVAGRSQAKLDKVVAGLAGWPNTASALLTQPKDVIIADVNDADAMKALCTRVRLVINCTGPFRFYGDQVVKACVEAGTNYCDITGEPEFIESLFLKYGDAAKAAGCSVVPSCGFDSVPADLGSSFAQQLFENEGGCCNAIESYFNMKMGDKGGSGHMTTWEAAVNGFGAVGSGELGKIRKALDAVYPRPPRRGKGNPRRDTWHQRKGTGKWSTTFPGSDASVVRRSQSLWTSMDGAGAIKHPISYSAYISFMSTWTTWLVSFGGLILMTLAPYSFGRKILLDYAETLTFGGFSHAGPTTEQLADMSFTMRMYATGSSVPPAADGTGAPVEDVTKVIEVAGPEPGYVATPRFVVNAAYVLLKAGRSGVMTPAVALSGTDYLTRLERVGITITELSALTASNVSFSTSKKDT